jgi:hypothetical protein
VTLGEHIATQGLNAAYTLLKCAVAVLYWALDR